MTLGFLRMRNRARSVVVGGVSQHTLEVASSMASQVVAVPQATGSVEFKTSLQIDFAAGAKAFKRSRLKHSLMRAFVVSCILTALVLGLLAGMGTWLNHRYAGKALPYTFIGGVSVGGLTQNEIKQVLDSRIKELTVTLQDGGLRRQVSLSELGVKFDTIAASQAAMHEDMQLLSYLVRKHIEVPVTVNSRYLEGYLADNIHNLQAKPVDAAIVKSRGKLVLQPEQFGFKSDSEFVARAITSALTELRDPLVNVNVATLKPKVYAAQLQDDFESTQALLKTAITLRVSGSNYKITEKQRYDWLQLKSSSFDGTPEVSFDRGAVRAYVSTIARRNTADGKQLAFDVEQATDKLLTALASGASAVVDMPRFDADKLTTIEVTR